MLIEPEHIRVCVPCPAGKSPKPELWAIAVHAEINRKLAKLNRMLAGEPALVTMAGEMDAPGDWSDYDIWIYDVPCVRADDANALYTHGG